MALKAFLILVIGVNASFLLATLKPVSLYCWNTLLSHSSVGAGALEVGLVAGPGGGLVAGPGGGLVVGPGDGLVVGPGVGLVVGPGVGLVVGPGPLPVTAAVGKQVAHIPGGAKADVRGKFPGEHGRMCRAFPG